MSSETGSNYNGGYGSAAPSRSTTNFNGGSGASATAVDHSVSTQGGAIGGKTNTSTGGGNPVGANTGKTNTGGPQTGPAGTLTGGGNVKSTVGLSGALKAAANPAAGLYGRDSTNPAAPTRDQLDARINAVSRGPGPLEGTLTSNPFGRDRAKEAQRQTALALGTSVADRYGLPSAKARELVNNMVRTVAGEAGQRPAVEQAAAARTMANRLDLAKSNAEFSSFSPEHLLDAYDAAGLDPNRGLTKPNSAFKAANPGTKAAAKGLLAVASGLSPYGSLATVPDAIKNATHYLNSKTVQAQRGSLPSWAQNGTKFGAHTFFTPDSTIAQTEAARVASLQPATAATQVADNTPFPSNKLGFPPAPDQMPAKTPVEPMQTLVSPQPEEEAPSESVKLGSIQTPEDLRAYVTKRVDEEIGKLPGWKQAFVSDARRKLEIDKAIKSSGITFKDGRVNMTFSAGKQLNQQLAGLNDIDFTKGGIPDAPITGKPSQFATNEFPARPAPALSQNNTGFGIVSPPTAPKSSYPGAFPPVDRPTLVSDNLFGRPGPINPRGAPLTGPFFGRPEAPGMRPTLAASTHRPPTGPTDPMAIAKANAERMVAEAQRSRALMNQGIQLGDLGAPTPDPSLIANPPVPQRSPYKRGIPTEFAIQNQTGPRTRTAFGPRSWTNYMEERMAQTVPDIPGLNSAKVTPSTVAETEKALGNPTVVANLGLRPATEPGLLKSILDDVRANRERGKEAAQRLLDKAKAIADTSLMSDADAWYAWLSNQNSPLPI